MKNNSVWGSCAHGAGYKKPAGGGRYAVAPRCPHQVSGNNPPIQAQHLLLARRQRDVRPEKARQRGYQPVTDISLRFWGVRGSVPCPEPSVAGYGGNTPCVEVRCGDHFLVLDGGTGLRSLGDALLKSGAHVDCDIFLSHCHFDHICGLPFFAPTFLPSTRLRLWAGNLLPVYKIEDVLRMMVSAPLFPIGIEALSA